MILKFFTLSSNFRKRGDTSPYAKHGGLSQGLSKIQKFWSKMYYESRIKNYKLKNCPALHELGKKNM